MRDGWIVARTQPRRERWAAENLVRQNFEFYLPQIEQRIGRLMMARPLFPNYIFVRFCQFWRPVLSTFGISSVLMNGGDGPALLHQRGIDELRSREDKTGFIVLPPPPGTPRFKPGQQVKIKEGTLAGKIGLYQGCNAQHCEKVLLDFLGRKTTVLIASELLEAAS